MCWSLKHGQVSMLASKEPPLALHCFSLATSSSKTPPSLWAPTNPQPLHRTGLPPLTYSTQVTTPPARQLAIISPWTPQALMTGMSQSHGAAHLLHSPIKQQGSSPPHPHLQLCACSCPMPSSHACTSPCPHLCLLLTTITALHTMGGLMHMHTMPLELSTLTVDQFAYRIFHMLHVLQSELSFFFYLTIFNLFFLTHTVEQYFSCFSCDSYLWFSHFRYIRLLPFSVTLLFSSCSTLV